MNNFVPGRGPYDAKIIVVGEAPGKREMALGQPFVGPSGRLLQEWIAESGLRHEEIRYENVYPTMPPGGGIEAVPLDELRQWQEDCLARLDEFSHARVIVPTGNVALGAVLGCDYWHANITKRRGSIFLWNKASGRKVKVIPVIHPAAVLREEGERGEEEHHVVKKSYEFRCRQDWKKIAREVGTGIEEIPPRRLLIVQPSVEEWGRLVALYLRIGKKLAFDIETNPELGRILCISFATDDHEAVSVPWSKGYKEGIVALLTSPMEKITQNGQYDCYWLRKEGFAINNWKHDTMAKSCLLWPNEPHSLAYLASILTNEPWYKGGDEDTGEKHWKVDSNQPDRWRALLEYNARDSVVTWEINEREDELLQAKGWMQTYQEEYQALFMPILETMLHGIQVDLAALSQAHDRALAKAFTWLKVCQHVAGRELFTFDTQVQEAVWKVHQGEWEEDDPVVAKKLKRVKGKREKYVQKVEAKGVSNTILAKVLYGDMGLPAQRNRITKQVTTDEGHLLKLRAKYSDVIKYANGMQLIEGVLGYREQKKQSEFLNPARLDADNRFRSSYSFRPSTGRLSSSSNPQGRGGNIQNIDRDLRGAFRPDAGCVMIEVDLSQAEARVVYCLTRDKTLIELAHMRPSQFDVHSHMAREVFEFGPWDDDEAGRKKKEDDRYLAKRIVHATHYYLRGNKGSEICLKDGYSISPKRFEMLQGKYKDYAPGLDLWQTRTRYEVFSTRRLTNAWGRTIEFPYEKPGDDWYRRAYAWRPQSDIARHLNHGWVVFAAWLRGNGLSEVVHVNLQLHDALIFSAPLSEAYRVTKALVCILEEPHEYYGEVLTIPAEVKVGLSWGSGVKFKEMPFESEFVERVEQYCAESQD